jgi:hypothetical protein
VELHGLLALVGAGNAESLERWLARRQLAWAERLVCQIGEGLRSYASGDYRRAAAKLSEVMPFSEIGGSLAQNAVRRCPQLIEAERRLGRVA